MKKGFIIAAVVLIAAGVAVFAGFFIASGSDFSKLDDTVYETKTYPVEEAFDGIEIDVSEADVVFMPSVNGKASVECLKREKTDFTVSAENGVLKIAGKDERKWYDRSLFSLKKQTVTLYLPAGGFGALRIDCGTGDVSLPGDFTFASADITAGTGDVYCGASADGAITVKTTTGDIRIEGARAGEIELSVSTGCIDAGQVSCGGTLSAVFGTGKLRLTEAVCERLVCEGSTGDVILKNTVASESFDIKAGTGDVRFDDCDSGQISVNTSTGSVTGTLLTEKVFVAKASTGRVDVPDTVSGGSCRITPSTGDISIELAGKGKNGGK